MDVRLARRIETSAELLASALLAGAVGYVVQVVLGRALAPTQAVLFAVAASAISFVLTSLAFRRGPIANPSFRTRAFEAAEFAEFEPDELILSEQDRLVPDELVLGDADRLEPASEPLLLDDVLAEIDPDSRVVRLFDRKAMPTPGQLQSRIDHHLGHRQPTPAPQDASQALSDALAELRRSLR